MDTKLRENFGRAELKAKQGFLQEFAESTRAVPYSTSKRLWDEKTILVVSFQDQGNKYTVNPDHIYLEYIEAKKRRQGHGTEAMRWLTALADKHDLAITVDLEHKSLAKWYMQFGFTRCSVLERLIREPGASNIDLDNSNQPQGNVYSLNR